MTVKGAHMFLTCIDGSDASDVAFRSVINMRHKFDHVCVYHAFKGAIYFFDQYLFCSVLYCCVTFLRTGAFIRTI